MGDQVTPYAGQTVPMEQALRSDPEMDAIYNRLNAAKPGQHAAPTLGVRFRIQVRMAQVARATMRDRKASQLQRDVAAVTYGRHCDLMMDLLDAMSEQQLTEISAMRNRRVR